ncbi:MAG: 4-phosphoerythronate dehydrogenase PdxB [Tannerellaceae bacterium]|nr:4-phosphoerythronate dehydrogenase PdxB [Tannerellaceae bacterium]
MLIIADQSIPYLKGVLEPYAEIRYLPSTGFTADNIRDAEILIVRSIDICNKQLLEGSRVKLITTATIGYDHIDTAYCEEAGIIWKNAPGCNAASVGQYVLSSLLYLSLRKGVSLKGKTIGIVGVGHVGKEVEKLCAAYGMSILRNDPPRAETEGETGFVSLEEIAGRSDIVTFHTPLTKTGAYPTWHLANEEFFSKCKRQPWFINASRGAVHDTKALLKAYQKGLISELIIDCWENEPHINPELLSCTTIATPHIAGFSADGKANATRMCGENIEKYYKLEIRNLYQIQPAPPEYPFIDLNKFANNRIERAFLSSYNPEKTNQQLCAEPGQFERIRSNYKNPREPHAYTLLHVTPEEAELGELLGFKLDNSHNISVS